MREFGRPLSIFLPLKTELCRHHLLFVVCVTTDRLQSTIPLFSDTNFQKNANRGRESHGRHQIGLETDRRQQDNLEKPAKVD